MSLSKDNILHCKRQSFRKAETDRADTRIIAPKLMSDAILKLYINTAYHNSEIKSLIKYRFDKAYE